MTQLAFLSIEAVLVLGSLVMGGKDVASLAILLTLGLAYPLAYAPTALIYFNAAAVPFLILRRWPALGILAAAALCVAVAWIPGALSGREADAIRARTARETVVVPIGGAARNVALRYRVDPDHDRVEEEICGRVCRGLLLGGAVDVVTVTTTERGRGTESTTFVAAAGDACVRTEVSSGPARCVVPSFIDPGTPDLVVEEVQAPTAAAAPSSSLAPRSYRGRRVTASLRDPGGSARIVFAKADERLASVAVPFRIGPRFTGGLGSLGYEIVFDDGALADPITLDGLFAVLGYAMRADLAPAPAGPLDPPSAEQDNRARAVLDRPASSPLNHAHAAMLSDWSDDARGWKPMPPRAVAMVRRLVDDPGVGWVRDLDELLAKPDVAPALVDDMVALCRATPATVGVFDKAAQIGYALARVPAAVAAEHRADIDALATADDACGRALATALRNDAEAARDRRARGR